jgi:hypothetical protein
MSNNFYCMELEYYTYADDIEDLRTAYYEKMGKVPLDDLVKDKIWILCVDLDKCKAVGCFSYTTNELYLMMHDFYVSTLKAIKTMQEEIDLIQKEINLPMIFGVDAQNKAWIAALEKRGYIPNTIIFIKEN